MKRLLWWTLIVGAFVAAGGRDAYAQMGSFKGFLTGHVGAIAGGEVNEGSATFGAAIAVHDDTGWGAEFDFGHTADAESGKQILDVTSYMVNASFIKRTGQIRPFSVVGAGVLQVNGCDSPCNRAATTTDFGMNIGAGAFFVVNEYFGLRGDVRYMFSSADHPDLNRPDSFRYWRVTFGATYLWSIAP